MDSLGSVLINREIGDLIMNAASWIVLFILVMIVGFILYRIVKRTKNGMPPTCGKFRKLLCFCRFVYLDKAFYLHD